ncbi:hypothetical protein ACQ4M4_26365 [Leptolyngbya sp. AN02str]|uniref:hypothetical protein n=1 Tax=Leptolyngbya sp. AN02str TaxID=3423363 RepID=UPI003D311D90
MAQQSSAPQDFSEGRSPEEIREQRERMQDVMLMLDNMFRREEITLKLIIDNLYDVGVANIIHQKLKSRPLKRLSRGAAQLSKPLARRFAARWVQKNCPKLIADWLYSKVKFEAEPKEPIPPAVEAVEEALTEDNTSHSVPQPLQTGGRIPTTQPPQPSLIADGVSPEVVEEMVNAIVPEVMEEVAETITPRVIAETRNALRVGAPPNGTSPFGSSHEATNGAMRQPVPELQAEAAIALSEDLAEFPERMPMPAISKAGGAIAPLPDRTTQQLDQYVQEISRLRGQVRRLGSVLLLTLLVLGGTLVWAAVSSREEMVQPAEQAETVGRRP